MSDETDLVSQRLAKLEQDYAVLLDGGEVTTRRYNALLAMVRELTLNTVTASHKAAESAEKSLAAGNLAAEAAKAAALAGALKVADIALEAARISANAAADAAIAASEAWTAALVAAGHNAENELLSMSSKASHSSRAATIAAAKALEVFTDAYEAVKKVAAGTSI